MVLEHITLETPIINPSGHEISHSNHKYGIYKRGPSFSYEFEKSNN